MKKKLILKENTSIIKENKYKNLIKNLMKMKMKKLIKK